MEDRKCPKLVMARVWDLLDKALENLQEPSVPLDLSILGPMKLEIRDTLDKEEDSEMDPNHDDDDDGSPEDFGTQVRYWTEYKAACAKAQVEKDSWCRELIQQRILDGHADPAPVLEDVTTATLPPCQGILAGFPCQGTSRAGEGLGIDDPRSGLAKELWKHWDAQDPEPILDSKSPA
eukprot:Skav204699  [mRNA]  locus=scaffold1632:5264:8167:- [translate_table: standard]